MHRERLDSFFWCTFMIIFDGRTQHDKWVWMKKFTRKIFILFQVRRQFGHLLILFSSTFFSVTMMTSFGKCDETWNHAIVNWYTTYVCYAFKLLICLLIVTKFKARYQLYLHVWNSNILSENFSHISLGWKTKFQTKNKIPPYKQGMW